MKETNQDLIDKVLELRRDLLHRERDAIKKERPSIDDASLYDLSKTNIGKRHFPGIKTTMNTYHGIDDIIFNDGGDQNKKMGEHDKNGKRYIHISSDMTTEEEDRKRGFFEDTNVSK